MEEKAMKANGASISRNINLGEPDGRGIRKRAWHEAVAAINNVWSVKERTPSASKYQ